MEHNEIFERACLIQMTSSVWSASKSIDPVLLRQLGEHSEWLKGRKNLINPEVLGQIRTAAHQARNKVKQYALPFPITSIQLIPKEYIATVEEILQQQEQIYWNRVEEFISIYDEAREEARNILGDLFNETDYPQNIRSKFKFGWQFLALQVPSQTTILSPELYEREVQRFEHLMHETRELCMQALRTEFSGLISELTEKLSSNGNMPKKILTNSMFNKLNEFFSEFRTKNIFEDQTLVELTENAKRIISDVSLYNLKYNDQAKEAIRQEMQTIKQALDAGIDIPRRNIRLEHLEAA